MGNIISKVFLIVSGLAIGSILGFIMAIFTGLINFTC